MVKSKNKKILIFVTLIAFFIGLAAGIFIERYYLSKRNSCEIVQVPSINKEEIKKALPEATESDASKIEKEINNKTENSSSDYEYFTYSDKEADNKAIAYASKEKNKPDKILKASEKVNILDNNYNLNNNLINSGGGENEKINLYQNKYYAINLEKKHEIKVGAAYIHDAAYGSVSYRNRDLEYTAFYAPKKNSAGVAVSYTIAKW